MLVVSDADDADADDAEGGYDKCINVMMLMLNADTTSHNGIKAGLKIFGLVSLMLMLLLVLILMMMLLPAMLVCLFVSRKIFRPNF